MEPDLVVNMENKLTSYPKDKINILFLENISDAAVNHFKNSGYASVRKLKGALTEEQLIEEIKDVHLLGIRSKTQITKKVLDHARKLQAIGCFLHRCKPGRSQLCPSTGRNSI